MTAVWSGVTESETVTVVVGMTRVGVRPGVGARLRALAVLAGLAGIGWLLGAVLGAGPASADEPPATDPGDLTAVVDGITNAVTTDLRTTVDATSATPPAAPKVSKTVRAHRVVPVAVVRRSHPVPQAVVPTHHTVVPVRRHAVAPVVHRHVPATPRHRHAPVRAPPSQPPQPGPSAPGPALPGLTSTHTAGDLARQPLPADSTTGSVRVPGGATLWAADPARLAARIQCLPATSPD